MKNSTAKNLTFESTQAKTIIKQLLQSTDSKTIEMIQEVNARLVDVLNSPNIRMNLENLVEKCLDAKQPNKVVLALEYLFDNYDPAYYTDNLNKQELLGIGLRYAYDKSLEQKMESISNLLGTLYPELNNAD